MAPQRAADPIKEPSDTVLRRELCLQAVIAHTSLYPQRNQEASSDPQLQVCNEIGRGLQGTIFERIGFPLVLKKEKPRNAITSANLKDEYAIHQTVHHAFSRFAQHPAINCDVSVPFVEEFISAKDETWPIDWGILPPDCRVATDGVMMERILPLPKAIRRALIEQCYPFPSRMGINNLPTVITQQVLDVKANKHCLVRPYLGIRSKKHPEFLFSLRNFILGLDDLRQFDFDVEDLAKTLGKAYAILHWGAQVNGDDVEFVIGSSINTGSYEPTSLQHRKIGLFLLDFGQCDRVSLEDEPQAVYQAFKGAMVTGDNACFIPNRGLSPQLFSLFKDAYSVAAKEILAQELVTKFDIDGFMNQYQEYAEDFL